MFIIKNSYISHCGKKPPAAHCAFLLTPGPRQPFPNAKHIKAFQPLPAGIAGGWVSCCYYGHIPTDPWTKETMSLRKAFHLQDG